jgi:hypothetical protein
MTTYTGGFKSWSRQSDIFSRESCLAIHAALFEHALRMISDTFAGGCAAIPLTITVLPTTGHVMGCANE